MINFGPHVVSQNSIVNHLQFNPLTPKSDKHVIPSNSITTKLNVRVIAIKDMIVNLGSS